MYTSLADTSVGLSMPYSDTVTSSRYLFPIELKRQSQQPRSGPSSKEVKIPTMQHLRRSIHKGM